MGLKVCLLIFSVAWSAIASVEALSLAFRSAGAEEGIDVDKASKYFQEASEMCVRDAGRLWGISLYGPMLFVDPDSRAAVANQADPEGRLRKQGQVFVGALPGEVNVANTATIWAGVKWTMVIWPLPEERRERLRLMAHELFHRIQDQIKLESPEVSNRHLNSKEGRIWLRLEWRALERALQESGAARRHAVADAILFRRYRQSLFEKSSTEECLLETKEGLAEYTGVRLSSRSSGELTTRAIDGLRQARNKQSFVRSFAYASGPAYGALLDLAGLRWRRGLKSGDDMSSILQRGLRLKLPPISESDELARAENYDGDEVIANETRRETIRREGVAKYRAKLIDGPVLAIPVAGSFNYSYNPNNLVPLDETCTVYPMMRVTDDWGILEVSDGALLIRDATGVKSLAVAGPTDPRVRPLHGPGWKLELNAGWSIEPGDRKGDLVLRKQ